MIWRAPRTGERQLAWIWALSSVTILAMAPLWPRLVQLAPRCTFHRLTGLPCPTCGTTRAALALFHGHLLEALGYNPLMTILGGMFMAGGLTAPVWLLAGLQIPVIPTTARRPLRIVALLAILANWAFLLLSGR